MAQLAGGANNFYRSHAPEWERGGRRSRDCESILENKTHNILVICKPLFHWVWEGL